MPDNVGREVAALPQLSVSQLRARYADLFGEVTAAHHRTWLIRRLAWRLQMHAEGDLSERARQRASELTRDADLRLNPPKGPVVPEAATPPACGGRRGPAANRLPPPGTVLTRPYKGQVLKVQVLAHGFIYAGTVYRSLSAVAKAITGSHTNGFLFFHLNSGDSHGQK
jgi:Protein of unknown function (DUF2924)